MEDVLLTKHKPVLSAKRWTAASILEENRRRQKSIHATFNPITGEGSIGTRKRLCIDDFYTSTQFVPKRMMRNTLVRNLQKYKSIDAYLCAEFGTTSQSLRDTVVDELFRTRIFYDFAFWAATMAFIHGKGGGEDIFFVLNRPQRRLIAHFEAKRLAGKPIRLVLLKARQWGGSTAVQMYMAWLQLVVKKGLNSIIVGHEQLSSDNVLDMFDNLITNYPIRYLYETGETYKVNEKKWVNVGKNGHIHRVPQRKCKITTGTAERPKSVGRSGDYNLVHLTEVGLWKKTEGKTPEDIVDAATSGVLLRPYTMIVYESTAQGTGNFFQREYDAAKAKRSQFDALFIAWFDIDQYSMEINNLEHFAAWLLENKDNEFETDERHECGKYLWWLWEMGATLEAINWYTIERMKFTDHGHMASEYPSDDVEAFVHSGARVFDKYNVEKLRPGIRIPKFVGDVIGDGDTGKAALSNIRFTNDKQGMLMVWAKPEHDDDYIITNRYLVVVDIGGRSGKADWSVICVFDRYWMMDGGKPCVVAQWYGHIDMDILAWKAAQIAKWYENALLVIESNTLETHDKERSVDGDQSSYILSQIKGEYDNLYARRQSEEDIIAGIPKKYGFHTNVSTKPMIISTLVKAIRETAYTEREERCLDEYLQYERRQNGSFGAITGKHDDILMTRAIGLHICFYEMDTPREIMRPTAARRARTRASERRKALRATAATI